MTKRQSVGARWLDPYGAKARAALVVYEPSDWLTTWMPQKSPDHGDAPSGTTFAVCTPEGNEAPFPDPFAMITYLGVELTVLRNAPAKLYLLLSRPGR